jgi:hypothetical protein
MKEVCLEGVVEEERRKGKRGGVRVGGMWQKKEGSERDWEGRGG